MDLKQNKITIGELMANEKAQGLVNQFGLGKYLNHPLAALAKGWTLEQALEFARGRGMKEEQINMAVQMLEQL